MPTLKSYKTEARVYIVCTVYIIKVLCTPPVYVRVLRYRESHLSTRAGL